MIATFLAGPSGGNTGHNHYGTAGVVIAIVIAVAIVVLWFVLKGRR